MDLTFHTEEGIFNCRVCAVILRNGTLLAMKNERTPYYFLPGGRIRFGETMEEAVLREVREELGIEARILRPLWLNQGFFQEDITGKRFHELCLYFLMDISGSELEKTEDTFLRREESHTNQFHWLPVQTLQEEYLYPVFIKEKILSLPEQLTLQAEYE